MTQPDEARQVEGPGTKTAQDRLRRELLKRGLYDWLPLGEVDSLIIDEHLAETLPAQQELALRTIRSLVEDGLMEVGDLPSQGHRLIPWDVSLDAAMARIYERFVCHYDDPAVWDYSIWLGLTDAGKRVATALAAEAGN